MIWALLIVGVLCTAFGYTVSWFGSWMRVHQQESHLRRLSNDIAVMVDMGDTVPPEWVQDQLETMIARDYR
jgi:hypothetical protein